MIQLNSHIIVKEKIFMACNVQKGIAVAVVVFTLSILNIEGIDIIMLPSFVPDFSLNHRANTANKPEIINEATNLNKNN